jgi:lysophospholipase L1-like esterase
MPCEDCDTTQCQAIDEWNISLRSLAQVYDAIIVDTSIYVGEFRAGGDTGNLWNIVDAYDYGDGLHFSALGRRQIIKALYDALP